MPPRVVLDSNVVISGLLYSGPPSRILDLALEGDLELAISSPLLTEVEGVLRRKFPQATEAVWETLATLQAISLMVTPHEAVTVVRRDPSDNRVLECALAAHADVIVSGDQHLLALRDFRGIPIFTPTAFLTHWRATRR